jgi:hypothetical protein
VSIGGPRRTCEGNIKMNLKEIARESVVGDKFQRLDLVNTAMNFSIP